MSRDARTPREDDRRPGGPGKSSCRGWMDSGRILSFPCHAPACWHVTAILNRNFLMVRAIIFWSLHNRLIVILGTLALVGIGSYSAMNLNVEAYPDPTPPLVEVITQNPGAS